VITASDPPPDAGPVADDIPAPSPVPDVAAEMAGRGARATSTSATDVVVGVPVAEAAADDDPDDDEPELTIAEAEPGELSMEDEDALSGRPAGAYRHRGGFVDVIAPRKTTSRAPARRPDANARARRGPNSVPPPDDDAGEDGGDGAPSRDPEESPRSAPPPAVPKVIVSMGDSVEALVHDLSRASRESAEAQVARVVEVGPAALPMLVQTFPGPLWHERRAGKAPPSSPRDISAIARALASFGDKAVPYLLSLFDHQSAEVRYYALLTASDVSHRDLVSPLSVRLFDADDEVAALAMQLLRKHRRFQREYQEALDRVRSTARSPRMEERQRVLALKALGELRDARSLRVLLQFLDQGPPRLSKTAHESLVLLTRQDFGDASKRWQPWVAENGSRHRIEWLIEALLHVDEEMRRAAGDELKQLTQEYYGYHPSLPRREREIAQKKYRAWWETEGQKRFSASP
jgi:hypothetical protein